MDIETAQIARRVDAARRDQGRTIGPLSIATGIPETSLGQFLAGKRDLPLTKFRTLLHELNLSPATCLSDPSVITPEAAAAA